MHSLYVDGELTPQEQRAYEAHLHRNPAFRGRGALFAALRRAFAQAVIPAPTGAEVEASFTRLQAALRFRGNGHLPGAAVARPAPSAFRWGLSAAAAALLIFALTPLLRNAARAVDQPRPVEVFRSAHEHSLASRSRSLPIFPLEQISLAPAIDVFIPDFDARPVSRAGIPAHPTDCPYLTPYSGGASW
jgi:anti-sigma factor RsiW